MTSPLEEPLLKDEIQNKARLEKKGGPSSSGQQEHESSDTEKSPASSWEVLATFLGYNEAVDHVGEFVWRGALVGLSVWLLLSLVVHFWLAPKDSFRELEGIERNANILTLAVLLVTNGSRFWPMVFEGRRVTSSFILMGAITVQCIAMISCALMAFAPTPVMVDSVTGSRTYLMRWAEWTPLAFIMTFLTEAIDLPIQQRQQTQKPNAASRKPMFQTTPTRVAWAHAICIGLSTSAGLLFPFAPNVESWFGILFVSCALFTSLYIRLYQRGQRFAAAKKGCTVESQERYDQCRLSYRLLQVCGVVWTLLVVSFLFCCIAPSKFPSDSIWTNPALPAVTECVMELSSKVLYLILMLHVNESVFDKPMRAVRRLEEMRDTMSAVWKNSSDVIAFCIPTTSSKTRSGRIKAIVSPAFSKLLDSSKEDGDNEGSGDFALLLDVEPPLERNKQASYRACSIDLQKVVTREEAQRIASSLSNRSAKNHWSSSSRSSGLTRSQEERNIAALADLVAKATFSDSLEPGEKEKLIIHDLFGRDPEGQREEPMQYEAKVTKLESKAVLIVLRDISERFQRFEAEKRLVREVTERKKDAEANRFARHEVKNGLLSAIAIVDSLKDAMNKSQDHDLGEIIHKPATLEPPLRLTRPTSYPPMQSLQLSEETPTSQTFDWVSGIAELDLVLQDVLDTVLDETMARDVVHERYELRLEPVVLSSLFSPIMRGNDSTAARFNLVLEPDPFPGLILDPQLLRYIHRNAVSNACRYGKPQGSVETVVKFQNDTIQMKVINLPGDHHEDLVKLSVEEAAKVFLSGVRLHADFKDTSVLASVLSSGEGAWIMKKCAKLLGGDCEIQFQKDKTVFALTCPAQQSLGRPSAGRRTFKLPPDTYGIAIDDSGIQRKLMDRFLFMTGIPKSNISILGKNSHEILDFGDRLEETIREHPEGKFLVIVDENLDLVMDGAHHKTVSGSQCVAQVRERLESDHEKRLLALIRSANDSSEDVALYKTRAHGFIPKAPMKKENVLNSIEPHWKRRFPSAGDVTLHSSISDLSVASSHGSESAASVAATLPSDAELLFAVESIDALCIEGDEEEEPLSKRWPSIRERIHILKGDLMTLESGTSARMLIILDALDRLKGDDVPGELVERWKVIRSLILSVI